MNIGMDFRGSINRLPGVLERVVARINTVWKKEHNPDGSHTNVSTSGDLVVGGDVSIEGGLEVEGPVNLGPNQYLDLKEYIPPSPPADTARLYALDVNGYTQVEMKDSAGRGVRFSSDNVIIAKISQAGGIYRGQAVYITGAAGANSLVALALSNSLSSMPAIGIVLDAGENNVFTRVLTSGTLQGVDTSAFAEGVPLFVSSTQPGGFTSVPPASPNFAQRVGFVTRSHATQGEILVLTTATAISGGTGSAGDVEYLGDYVPVTYNSGDIVVGPDGITYMCVKDGTTTPPEPWPPGANVPLPFHHGTHETGGSDPISALSGAVITSGTVPDARLSANVVLKPIPAADLPAHQARHRSGGADPVDVKTLAGYPGDPGLFLSGMGSFVAAPAPTMPANVAYTNVANPWTVAQVLPTTTEIRGDYGWLTFTDTSSPADNKAWRMLNYHNGHMYLEALNDGGGVMAQFLFGRNATLSAPGGFGTSGFVQGANFTATGGITVNGAAGINCPSGPLNVWYVEASAHIRAAGGLYDYARATPIGVWIDVAYNAAHYYGNNGMTVGSAGAVVTNRYMLVGKTLFWNVYLANGSLGTAVGSIVYISLPPGFTAAVGGHAMAIGELYAPGEGWMMCYVAVDSNGTYAFVQKPNKGNFASTTPLYIRFTIAIQIP